jgi:two-component system osmolarity sensor histidine kinase EnvZ
MRLQLEMLDVAASAELKTDVAEMEHMLDAYLDFARGDGAEHPTLSDLGSLLESIVRQARRKGGNIDLHVESELMVPLRLTAFKRGMTNIVDNAIRYGEHVTLRAGARGNGIEITIDDDGPGIPEDRRDDAFKAFYRLDASRNPGTGGVGLGLAIARDVVRGHGGEISLQDAPSGGLRVRLMIPL